MLDLAQCNADAYALQAAHAAALLIPRAPDDTLAGTKEEGMADNSVATVKSYVAATYFSKKMLLLWWSLPHS